MSSSSKVLNVYRLAAGSCDTLTGILLLTIPEPTLRMLSLPEALREPSLAGLIGAFVLGTGLSYFTTGGPPRTEAGAARWKAVWTVTALIRICVAVYLFAGVAIGRMQPGWLTVAVSDAAMAALQIAAMWAGWLATCVCDREKPL